MIARSIALLLGMGILAGGTTWGQAPDRLAPSDHTRPGATRPATRPTQKPTTRPATRPTAHTPPRHTAKPKPIVHRPLAQPTRPAHPHGPRFVKRDPHPPRTPATHDPALLTGHGPRKPLLTRFTPPPPPPPPRRMPPRAIPRSFADVFGGAFAGSTGPSGQVQTLDGAGRPRRLGSFRSLSATEIEISMHNGFLLRLILQDFDPATGMAIADTYLVDTAAQPNNPRVWSYKSSGRMQLPVGASPPQGALQTRWTNMGHGLPGGGVSISTPTGPTTLFFVP